MRNTTTSQKTPSLFVLSMVLLLAAYHVRNVRCQCSQISAGLNHTEATAASVGYNAARNEYLAVWIVDEGFVYRLYSRILYPNGDMGTIYEIPETTSAQAIKHGTAQHPSVAHDPGRDGYMVFFEAIPAGGVNEEIYMRSVDNDGSPGGAQWRLTDSGLPSDKKYGSYHPVGVYNPVDNRYFVVYETKRRDTQTIEIFGKIVSPHGTLTSLPVQISNTGTDIAYADHPVVAHNTVDNNYCVLWTGSDFIARGHIVSNIGLLIGGPFIVSPEKHTAAWAMPTSLAFNKVKAQYLVVWFHQHIYGQILDNNGTKLSDEPVIVVNRPSNVERPQVAYFENDDKYLVVWDTSTLLNPTTVDTEIQLRELNTTGYPKSEKQNITCQHRNASSFYSSLTIASSPEDVLVVWTGKSEGITQYYFGIEIWSRTINVATPKPPDNTSHVDNDDDDGHGVPTWAVVSITIAVLILLGLCAVFFYILAKLLCSRKRKQKKKGFTPVFTQTPQRHSSISELQALDDEMSGVSTDSDEFSF